MIVLGISPLDTDATVSLVVDGKVVFAAGEERFTRNKQQNGFPAQALQAGLQATGILLKDINLVAYPFFDWQKETQLYTENLRHAQQFMDETPFGAMSAQIDAALAKVPSRTQVIPGLSHANAKVEKPLPHKIFYRFAGTEGRLSRQIARKGMQRWGQETRNSHRIWQDDLGKHLRELNLDDKLKRFDHHLSHAASAYFASGFERALIVTLDGYGSGLSGSISVGEGNSLRRIHKLEYPHSLGTFYESVTSSLGFKPCRHEGKIVGLAAYGDPSILLDLLLSRFHQEPGTFRMLESHNMYFSRDYSIFAGFYAGLRGACSVL